MHCPQFRPARNATRLMIRKRCLSGLSQEFGNTNPSPGCRLCLALIRSASRSLIPTVRFSLPFTLGNQISHPVRIQKSDHIVEMVPYRAIIDLLFDRLRLCLLLSQEDLEPPQVVAVNFVEIGLATGLAEEFQTQRVALQRVLPPVLLGSFPSREVFADRCIERGDPCGFTFHSLGLVRWRI